MATISHDKTFDPAIIRKLYLASRKAQGLPPVITDPLIHERALRLINGSAAA
jgi:hypothetical protein